MVVLLAGMVIFANLRLGDIADGFTRYRSDARTAVNSNVANGAIREANDTISRFMLSLAPALMDRARAALDDAIKYIDITREVEIDEGQSKDLDAQAEKLKSMKDLTLKVQEGLLGSQKVMEDRAKPLGGNLNDDLSGISKAAIASGNTRLFELVDDAYSLIMDIRAMLRVYNASYQPADGEAAAKQLPVFDDMIKKMNAAAVSIDERAAVKQLADTFAAYHEAFNQMDSFIKSASQARGDLDATATSVEEFFASYTSDTLANMNALGPEMQAANEGAQHRLLILGAAGVVLGLLLAAWIIMGVVRVLGRLSSFAGEMANGNLDASLGVHEAGEIGAMVKAMESISMVLKKIIAEYIELERDIEEGKLDAQADASEFNGAFQDLMRGTNNILSRFRLVIDSIPSPVVVLYKDLKANFLNTTARGLAGDDYKGHTCKELFNRDDDGTATCALTRAVATLKPAHGETRAHPGGRTLDITYAATPCWTGKATSPPCCSSSPM